MELTLHDYWRSSSAYRVRIALNLKGVDYRGVEVDLLGGEQLGEGFAAVNPQKLVPALEVDGQVITQSLAIIDWLDGKFPQPRLIPADPIERARTLAQAQVIIADTQPVQNLRVLKRLRAQFGADDAAIDAWVQHWIGEGLATLEVQAPEEGFFGGETPNIVDVVLVPQLVNARRYKLDLTPFPRLLGIEAAMLALEAVAQARPEAIRPG